MTPNDFKKFNKLQLLEMLLLQTKRVEELELQLEEKNSQLIETQKKLEEKQMKFEDIGSLAQAAMQMNNIFRRADKAAEEYLENVKQFTEDVERLAVKRSLAAKKEIEERINTANAQAEEIIAQANKKRQEIIEKATIGK